MTTPADTARPAHVAAGDVANAASDNAARLWGSLEAAERAASLAWTQTYHAARAAGDDATAAYALETSRRHWHNADRLAALFARR